MRFSIIVPVYKVEKYLRQCVDSLLNQDFNSFELLLVDDGSPDSCPQICDEYAAKDSRVRVIHKENGGLSDARNAALAYVNGEYITFVDSDDFWYGTDVLSRIDKIIQRDNPDIIASDFFKYYETEDKLLAPNNPIPDIHGTRSEILEEFFCQADMRISACQKFGRAKLLTSIPFTKGLLSEDIDWTFQVYSRANSIAFNPEPYYCYRQQREGSISNTASSKSFQSLLYIVDKWEREIPQMDITQSEKEIFLGYLAYQLSIAMLIWNRLPKPEKAEGIELLRKHLHLFEVRTNYKTQKVKCALRILGLKNTCRLLSAFDKMRK